MGIINFIPHVSSNKLILLKLPQCKHPKTTIIYRAFLHLNSILDITVFFDF
jgi:hypothetical protein